MSAGKTEHGRLWNEDLAPTGPEKRTWSRWNIAALWVGMSICVPTYMLAAGLIKSGMSWWQAVLTVLAGNLIVLVPMVLNAHAGTKYGIPFPVFLRAPFGVLGSNVPAMLRALVACGWFGIQTWIGGFAIYTLLCVFFEGWKGLDPVFLGLSGPQIACFLGFWAINVFYIVRGTESIKWMETFAAPFLLVIGLALLGWGVTQGGGLANVLERSKEFSRPSVTAEVEAGVASVHVRSFDDRATEARVQTAPAGGSVGEWTAPWRPVAEVQTVPVPEGHVVFAQLRRGEGKPTNALPASPPREDESVPWSVIFIGLTGMVGFWATLSLNIPDFTRFAKSQKDQVLGQLIGLPTTMALYSFIGVAVTCASVVVFSEILVVEEAPWDPVVLLGKFEHPGVVVLSMLGLAIATLTTNIAANVVSPANDFSNLAPRWIGFKAGGLITALIGIAIMPWKLIESTDAYIFTWLVGYGALLGPIGGIMIADYFLVRRTRLAVDDLYRESGPYWYGNGFNGRALAILAIAVLPNVPGFLVQGGLPGARFVPAIFVEIYHYAWFVGFAIAFVGHALLGVPRPETKAAAKEPSLVG